MLPRVIEVLNKLDNKNVFFGPQGFSFPSSLPELEELHQTYANDRTWNSSWQVFSQDTELGDPYFVDTTNESLPVYTAMHGEGSWGIELVSSSLESFINCVKTLNELSCQEYAQIIPVDSTLTNHQQLKDLERKLILNSGAEEFWQVFFECYMDWLEEGDS